MVAWRSIVYTLTSRFLLILTLLLFALPGFILIVLVPQKYRYNRCFFIVTDLFFKTVLACSLLPITIKGDRNVLRDPSIVIANHSSSLDIPLIGSLLHAHAHIWLAMQWLLQFWTFKYLLPRVAIIVDMDSTYTSVRSLIKIIRMVREQSMHIIIFPEGGRFVDGSVHDFYAGFVMLSKRTGYPVVPIKLIDAYKVYPPDSFWLQYHPIEIIIGKPMHQTDTETDEQFKQRVHDWYTAKND